MDDQALLAFMRRGRYWVEATVAASGAPQAAVVGVVVSEAFEVFFDTEGGTRKAANLRREPRVALVMWDGAATVQLEGLADEPEGDDLRRLKSLYFERFPDGREREKWPDIRYVRVKPTWLRYADYGVDPPDIRERRFP